MSLSVELDDYLIENNSNFLIKNDDVLFTITPYGLITSMYYFNSNIIDYIEDTNNIYVLLDNSLIKINRTTKEETTYQISGTNIDINNDILIISNNNSIYFYNTNGELISIFGENTTPELKEYYLKRNYNTKYLTNILDIEYKDDYLYVLENNNTLRVFLINLSNKQIRAYKTLTNINISNITYEDKLIGNNYEIDNFKTSNIINTRTNKSYIKYPNILIDEATSIYYQSIISVYNTLDDNTVLSFKNVETKDIDISKIDNTLVIDNNDIESIILLNEKGNSYEYKLNGNRYIDISNINDGKYFIYTKVNSIVYNVNRYIVKRSIYE
jgi:hypothetical protein